MANNQVLASDTFASGSLAAGWSPIFGDSVCQVVVGSPNVTEPNVVGTSAGQMWTGLVWPKDHTSEITIQSLVQELGTHVQLNVRMQSGSLSGYQANIVNSTAQIFRFDSGAFTQLATASSLTIAAGDVWALQAAGAVLSLYQNGKRILWIADPTYTSGTPGFRQIAAVNINHSQISSWRGYNAVQQDGIWQKQGVAVPAIASDLASTGFGAFQPCVIRDGSPQLLSASSVLKMWFTGGGATTSNIYYAESTDGVNWTRRGSTVLSGWSNGQVLKIGATYYMYAQAGNAQGSGNIAQYTSSDGINWVQQSTTILSKGGVGAWDEVGFYMLVPPVIVNGTWYVLYSASANVSPLLFKAGLATSSDGLNWTKYAGNPILSNAVPSCNLVNVSGTWYMWAASGPTSRQQAGSQADYNPIESVRYQSTDLIHWTNPIHSVHHSQMFESLNSPLGGFAPCSIVDVNGRAYLYSISSPRDGDPLTDNYQVGVAVAPASIAQIVTSPEDAVQQIASDNFTGGAGNLSGNWITPSGSTKLQIVGAVLEMSATSTVCAMCYTGKSFSSDQYSEITITGLADSSSFFNPMVRCQTASLSCYDCQIAGPTGSLTNAYINKKTAGANTQLGPTQTITVNIGDVFRLSVVGNVISLFQNGTLVQQVVDLNASYTSGFPGVAGFAATLANAKVSLWAGGNANLIPSYPGVASASPIPTFPTDAGPGTNTSVLVFGNGLGVEMHITPPDQASDFSGANPLGPGSVGFKYSHPSTKEVITTPGNIQFRNPA